jgi:hypothetical protein
MNPKSGEFVKCEELYPGCHECAPDGSYCKECKFRHQRVRSKEGNVVCESCNQYDMESNACRKCSRESGCYECEAGFWNFAKTCFMSPW